MDQRINLLKDGVGMKNDRKLNPEQKIGKCELCGKKNVIVQASGYYVAFVCMNCLK